MNSSKSPKPVGYFEIVFDVVYLTTLIVISVYMMMNAQNTITYWWVAVIMTLCVGDACHLLPRIFFLLSNKEKYVPLMNIGKQITSITMTVFYAMIWYVGCMHLGRVNLAMAALVVALSLVRIVMCLMPQNNWKSPSKDNKFNIYRNIPFVFLGLVVAMFFVINKAYLPQSFEWMWLAIIISFLFYIPVVLFYQKYPMVGMLMLPKTCMYVWIVCMGVNV